MVTVDESYENWALTRELDEQGSVPRVVKTHYLRRVLEIYELDVFVETGTFLGETVEDIHPYVNKVYSIEAYEDLFNDAVEKFENNKKVVLFLGDSTDILPEILEIEKRPALFWLDAHYSGPGTAFVNSSTPVVAEIEAISARGNDDDCVVIDDVRGFGIWDGYPTVSWLEQFVAEQFPRHRSFVDGDEFFILPGGKACDKDTTLWQ